MVVSSNLHLAGLLTITLTLVAPAYQIKAYPSPENPGRSVATGRIERGPLVLEGPTGAADPQSRSVTLAFAGDVHFEGRVAALLDRPGATIGPISAALRTADVAVVNLESALTTGGSRAKKELEHPTRRYWFRSPPSALGVLQRSGVDVVSMANNHGADYGAAGLRDSLRTDRSSPVDLIGVGRGPEQAFRPYTTSVNGVEVAVLAADASFLESNAPIWDAQPGRYGLARDSTRLLAAVRAANARSDVVAVYLHWGAEGRDVRLRASDRSPEVSPLPGPM